MDEVHGLLARYLYQPQDDSSGYQEVLKQWDLGSRLWR